MSDFATVERFYAFTYKQVSWGSQQPQSCQYL